LNILTNQKFLKIIHSNHFFLSFLDDRVKSIFTKRLSFLLYIILRQYMWKEIVDRSHIIRDICRERNEIERARDIQKYPMLSSYSRILKCYIYSYYNTGFHQFVFSLQYAIPRQSVSIDLSFCTKWKLNHK
jgi:hypothetical protein